MNPLHASFRIPVKGGWFCNLLPVEKTGKNREKRAKKITIFKVMKKRKKKIGEDPRDKREGRATFKDRKREKK